MYKTSVSLNSNSRYMSISNGAIYTGLGMNSIRKVAEEANAIRRIGRRVLIDKVALDKYLESQASSEE